jgi:hypothetical protein
MKCEHCGHDDEQDQCLHDCADVIGRIVDLADEDWRALVVSLLAVRYSGLSAREIARRMKVTHTFYLRAAASAREKFPALAGVLGAYSKAREGQARRHGKWGQK